ncbi:zinc finger C3H1 domain-containing protein isoform X5 [Amphiprion ocellaris]|uniref:zinc finger C3H1 domain-containing protein isoform X5 n=1 Tax=Amphiprion ocellaris TaxID=80972 RepID=UPI002410E9B9|nr:zinc finger C3H1 domain-containing protein isoform X5 [Amphiprion ocellaris]
MDLNTKHGSPPEDGELEDGEICDDEAEESVPTRRGDGSRPGGGGAPRSRKTHQHTHGLPPHLGHPLPDLRLMMPYGLGPHLGSFPPNHRQQCGPSGPDRPPAPSPTPALPPGLVPHGEPSPRSSFWERSHGALGRFRHRVVPNGGRGAWSRGGRGGNSRAPPGRYGPGESHGSPQRKQKLLGRNRPRKVLHSMSKPESSMDESFEDLLSKYRQIQLELECIRKEETMALEPDLDQDLVHAGGLQENRTEPAQELDRAEKKVFQAFNIKPLRQKIPSANLDELQRRWAEQDGGDGANAEAADGTSVDRPEPAGGAAEEAEHRTCENCGTNKPPCSCCRESSASSEESTSTEKRVEEEELSELQLRLLALQSASKKWQQKEQQVMKKSKERITKAVQDKSSGSGSGPGAAGPGRQRVTTRSASSAAAAERNRTRSNPVDRDRERTKTGTRLPERDRDRPKPPLDWGRVPGKPHVPKKVVSPGETGSAAKQAFRKQQLRTWKLQQQREQEEKRHHEEEERRKREDEIRRIRDLSNQDEQYNRFMKLVGGRRRTRSKSRDRDHRKSAGKAGLDSSGNLYQYDNYDEVAMDTDSETGSPVSSPTPHLLSAEEPGGVPQVSLCDTNTAAAFGMDLSQSYLSPMLSSVPPPPPLPPPPDDLEPPPKPPFADEEEEEEMLLRETCLMSMAHKRVASSEKTSSGPPSPSCLPPADVQLPPRGNLSTVSLNTVPPSRTKFSRGHHAARAPLVLPRHKAVVVSLNDSDDSDSDLDSCSSTQAVFGGLEFMIKEARRTVEAAKPKAASGCEKENNPVRPPEALPEAKKAEYCLLKEEIASREKQKMKDHSLPPQSSAASDSLIDSSLKPAVELKLAEAEQRLSKHRELLQRDEAVLRHLLQQELKKTESLKAAEAKVSKLKEQLQASERIVTANRTLLKKLQEQVHQVEHRVSMKKSLAVQLGQELLQAQLAAGKGPKRPAEPIQNQPSKLQRLDSAPRGSERHFVELIAQKQRLQQLESEYAQKIQKLKEAQALRNRGLPAEPPPASTPVDRQVAPPAGAFAVPQPSLHDLTQDKLTLDSEDAAEPEEPEPAPAAPSGRRSSLRQSSSSFTKPHLDTPSSAPSKDGGAKLTKTEPPAETSVGLDLDALRRRYQLQARLGDLLLGELQQLGAAVDGAPAGQVLPVEVETAASQSGGSELKPVPFGAYRSPLLAFRSYRFSPYYRTKEKLSLSSVTFSNVIEPNRIFCRFDLTGTCNDDSCSWQHMRNCTLTGNQLFEDILSYNLQLIGCSESSSGEDIGAATEKYMKKLFGSNKDRMGLDQKAVLLVSKVNESRRHVPPFTTCKDMRRWRPKPATQNRLRTEDGSEDEAGHLTPGRADDVCKSSLSTMDVCVTSEDRRYFISETDDISNLESSVQESPRDTQLWIKLAYKYLSQSETSAAESLEAALNTLSRALESNCDDPEVWSHYLTLFSRRGSREEVQEMCEMAVEHAPDRLVWWNVRLQYLTLESSFEGKDYVCERLLHFLQVEASSGVSEKLSFQLMEVLLYRVQLSMFSGRMESALALLQNALKSAQDRSVADLLLPADRVLLWLSFIHLTEFDRLPANLFDPAESGPSRLVSRDAFLLPWRTETDVSTPPDILVALFQDAIRQCSHESDLLACLPLHSNLILLHKLLHRYDEGVSLCESLLQLHPDSCSLRDALADLHLQRGNGEQAVGVWLHALAECPHNAEVFYRCCRFLMAQDQSSAVVPLFRGFVLSFCDDQDSQSTPVDILRVVLGFPSNQLLRGSIIRKELQEQLSQQKSFLHLIHCRWQWLHGSADQTVEAFERALGSTLQLDELHTLWMDYLLFSCSPQASDPARSRRFSDLVQRCLSTVPTRLQVPFNPAEFWSCYRFHNKVVSLYLSCLPPSQHALVLERLRYAMPNNTELGLRLLHQEFQDGSMEQLRFQARMLSSSAPRCLSVWKIAIAVETELKQRSEVRLLYQQAVQHLPLSAALWTHRLLSEAAEGGDWEKVRRLVDLCQQVGVSLSLGEALGPGGRSTDL